MANFQGKPGKEGSHPASQLVKRIRDHIASVHMVPCQLKLTQLLGQVGMPKG